MDPSQQPPPQASEPFADSFLAPPFLRLVAESRIRKVVVVGCGGGFDFVHSMLLYPELRRLGKKVVIVSNSFGDVSDFGVGLLFSEVSTSSGDNEGVERTSFPDIRLITASTSHRNPSLYAPELHLLSFLDENLPGDAPHSLFVCNARTMVVPSFSRFLEGLDADAIIAVDGGSDSLMKGDEEGLGDPVEDAVTVASVNACSASVKLLVSVGLGCDRFNHVSDASSLRAVAELTRMGGFGGCLGVHGQSLSFYRSCLDHINSRQTFRSVLAGSVAASGVGFFGAGREAAEAVGPRVRAGQCFLWPLMPILWAFDIATVARRSLIMNWIRDIEDVRLLPGALVQGRKFVTARDVEELPRHVDFRC